MSFDALSRAFYSALIYMWNFRSNRRPDDRPATRKIPRLRAGDSEFAILPSCQQYGRLSGGRHTGLPLLGLAGLKAVQIVNRPLGVAGGREDETLVALQHLQP